MQKCIRAFALLGFLLALPPSLGRTAEPIFAFEPEGKTADLNRGLEPSELYYHPSEELFYGENWHFLAKLDQGYVVYANTLITNLSLTRPSAAVEFSILAPDGKVYTSKLEYRKDEIHASTASYSIRIAQNTLGGEYPRYHFHLEQSGLLVDLDFENLVPGWKYNSGVVAFGAERRQHFRYAISSPNARVKGTLKFAGREVAVSGFGFQDHSLLNIPATSFSRRWFHLRFLSDPYTVDFTEIETASEYEPRKIIYVMVAEGDKIIYQGNKLELGFADLVRDDEYGYAWPKTVSVKIEDGNFSLTGQLKIERLLERIVVLSHLNPVLRGLVHSFIAKPVYYRCLNHADLVMSAGGKTAEIEGEAVNEVVFIK
jgi:hypothetical protein